MLYILADKIYSFMNRYVVFLRAINVSGKNIIKMEDLRNMLTMPGIKNISTYIQSGNVLLDTKETDVLKLQHKLEAQLQKQLGYTVALFLRTIPELEEVLRVNPFKDKEDDIMPYVTFLPGEPDAENVTALQSFNNETDTFRVIGRELYSYIVKDGTKSRMTPKFIETKLKLPGTTRNIRTVRKMIELGKATV